MHFVGASTHASDFSGMISSLFKEINSRLEKSEVIPIPTDDSHLVHSIPAFLAAASQKACYYVCFFVSHCFQGLIIVLDAINQLIPPFHSPYWLPDVLPPNVAVILSSTNSDDEGIKNKKNLMKLQISPLTEKDRRELVTKRLSLFGKTTEQKNVVRKSATDVIYCSLLIMLQDQLVSHPLSVNPLFLTTITLEMCITGPRKELQQKLTAFLSCNDISSLFRQVLTRWEVYSRELHSITYLIPHSCHSGKILSGEYCFSLRHQEAVSQKQ